MVETVLTPNSSRHAAQQRRQFERIQNLRRRLMTEPGALDDWQVQLDILDLLRQEATRPAVCHILRAIVPSRAPQIIAAADSLLQRRGVSHVG